MPVQLKVVLLYKSLQSLATFPIEDCLNKAQYAILTFYFCYNIKAVYCNIYMQTVIDRIHTV
jgi:hypothetical protein